MKEVTAELYDCMLENGSSYIPVSQFVTKQQGKLQDAVSSGSILVVPWKNESFLTLPELKEMEYFCARQIVSRSAIDDSIGRADREEIEAHIRSYEISNQVNFSYEQKAAVEMICNSHFSVLTGGPGTGKTMVLKCAINVIKKTAGRHISFVCTSPSGKAAKRITESCGFPASTLQSYTGGCDGTPIKLRGPDILVVDEASFIDLKVLHTMFKSLFPATKIVLIGDVEQLPSVGIGSVLRDIINSGAVRTVQLIKTFRQDDNSTLYENIQNVKTGAKIPFKNGSDFTFLEESKEDEIWEKSINTYLEEIKKYGVSETAILTPYRKSGRLCSDTFNRRLQALINPVGKSLTACIRRDNKRFEITFREGDPVIQLVNQRGIVNGETGKVLKVFDDHIIVEYEYESKKVTYWKKDLDTLDLAYAFSIHKSQGSEYKSVILPISRSHRNLSRNLLYTGISRAKKNGTMIGSFKVIQEACKKQDDLLRSTFLAEEIMKQLFQINIKKTIIQLHNWN